MSINDPIAIIDDLDPDAIEERLADLARQSDALRVLLRSARARQRGRNTHCPNSAAPKSRDREGGSCD